MYAIRARRKSISVPWHALAMDVAIPATSCMSRHLVDAEDMDKNDNERARLNYLCFFVFPHICR